MGATSSPRGDAELDAFLARRSPISLEYDRLELVEPSVTVDEKILAVALASARTVASRPDSAGEEGPGIAGAGTAGTKPGPSRVPLAAPGDEDEDLQARPPRRPRWVIPAALVGVLVAAGAGIAMLAGGPSSGPDSPGNLASSFAQRVRARIEAERTAAAARSAEAAPAAESAAAGQPLPPPPPPVFEPEGPRIDDLDGAIVLIRKELVLANQIAASQEEARTEASRKSAGGALPAGAAGVIQPRELRLSKIVELYDGGHPDLAADSLEIYLRDFADDPVSQRILGVRH